MRVYFHITHTVGCECFSIGKYIVRDYLTDVEYLFNKLTALLLF